MTRKPIALLIAGLFAAAAAAQAADDNNGETSGSVSIGARGVGVNANDRSKFNEYRDLDSGANVGFELRRRTDTDYLNGYGENIGRDDQYMDLNGGRFGSYKFRLYLDDMKHNFGAGPGAKSPYNGIGDGTLTGTFPNLNVDTWRTFDHSYKRRDVGGMFELQKASPWYARAEYNEVTRKGTNVFAGALGTSPGQGFMDLPTPINYLTRNYFGEAGYSGKQSHFAANVLYTNFNNGLDMLRWQNPNFGNGLDATVLPPDNEMWRIGANGNVRRLFLDSTLAARFTYSRLTNNVTVLQNALSTGGTNPTTGANEPNFRGDLRTTTFGLSLASHPIDKVDTKLYYNYFNQANDSTEMIFNPAVGSGLRLGTAVAAVNCSNNAAAVCEAELFHLKKSSFGAEAGYRMTRENRLQGGIEYSKADRERVDFPKTNETRWFAEWKNSSIDWLTGRLRYQRTSRHSTFDDTAVNTFAANPMDLYVRRFDLANMTQNMYKLVFDLTPMPLLDVGFEAIVKRNDYYDTLLGRRDDSRQEYYVSVGYGDPKSLRGLVFGDVEYVKFDSNHRVGSGNADPSTPATPTTYNWNATNKDRSWQVGIGLDWVPVSKLTVKSSAIYAETRGTADFSLQAGTGIAAYPAPISNFDNTRRTSFNLRAIYEYTKEWELSAGYAFERYRYSDIGYDGTRYVVPAANLNQTSYTTGQYAFQPYTANIIYGTAKYRF